MEQIPQIPQINVETLEALGTHVFTTFFWTALIVTIVLFLLAFFNKMTINGLLASALASFNVVLAILIISFFATEGMMIAETASPNYVALYTGVGALAGFGVAVLTCGILAVLVSINEGVNMQKKVTKEN